MFSTTKGLLAVIGAIFLLQVSCTSSDHSEAAYSTDLSVVPRSDLNNLDLFLSVTSDYLHQPFAMEVLPDGRLAVLDTDLLKVLIFTPDGKLNTRFGGKGKGPGEFVAPRGLFFNDSVISVNDVGMMRVNQFSLDGSFIQNYVIERESFFGFVAPGPGVGYYSVANGKNGKLVRYHETEKDAVTYFGEAPVSDPPPVSDSETFHASTVAGEVPDAIKNDLFMDYYEGQLYVYLKGISHLRKYVDQTLKWELALDLPVNREIFDNFVEGVTTGPSKGFGVLRYVNDIEATSDHVYLLWNETADTPQQIVQVNNRGEIIHIYRLSASAEDVQLNSIAVDEGKNRIYLAYSPGGEIYSTSLEAQ